MKKKRQSRRLSIAFIIAILFWNVLPMVTIASSFTPGKPITPGEVITPGDPITGGNFIAPGEVYDYGKAYNDGAPVDSGGNLNSGTPIIEGSTDSDGQFITPNSPPSLFPILGGDSIQSGDSVQAGDQADTGNAVSGGDSTQAGDGVQAGDQTDAGNAVSGEDSVHGGTGSNGHVPQNGNSSNGDATQGGNGPNGNAAEEGTGSNGDATQGSNNSNADATQGGSDQNGHAKQDGDGSNGNATEGGSGSSGNASAGNATDAEESPSFLNTILNSTKKSDHFIEKVANFAIDVRNYVLNLGDNVAQGLIATAAGFKFNQLADGKYAVYGKNNVNHSIGNGFYNWYRAYDYNGNHTKFGQHAGRIGEARYNAFMQSKNLVGTNGMFSATVSSSKSSMNKSWNVFSKSFWKPSTMMKMGGPVGVTLTSVGSISEYSDGFTDFSGLASTDFAASLTTDVAIGMTSTAAGSLASTMGTGALAGSLVPGVGTAIGAVIGLG